MIIHDNASVSPSASFTNSQAALLRICWCERPPYRYCTKLFLDEWVHQNAPCTLYKGKGPWQGLTSWSTKHLQSPTPPPYIHPSPHICHARSRGCEIPEESEAAAVLAASMPGLHPSAPSATSQCKPPAQAKRGPDVIIMSRRILHVGLPRRVSFRIT